jgi:hydroxyacylglutathione hydrolase
MEHLPMHLEPIPALSDNYIWLLADEHGSALVVDPGEAGPVEQALQRDGLRLEAILLTHHHKDHIGGMAELAARHGAVVHAPRDERIAAVDHRVGNGDTVTLKAPDLQFQVIEIPGHTRSHIAFHGHGMLFCGDTLFSLGCGRLFEGSPAQMLDSLDQLATLPDATLVCCAHEYTQANAAFARSVEPGNRDLQQRSDEIDRLRSASQPTLPAVLGQERACNPFLRVDSPEIVEWTVRQGLSDDAGRVERFATLRTAKDHFRA